MRGLARVASSEIHKVRRWDVVILGGALPGLIAAIRLGQRGARVLVVEEASSEQAAVLREPFLMVGADPDGVLGSCLRSLGVPLIDQRRFTVDDIAVQVVMPEARLDIGRAALTADELTAWGLAKPDPARALVRALESAALAERQAMLEGPGAKSRGPRRRAGERPGGTPGPVYARGWPREAVEAPEPVRAVLGAIGRGLSHLGETPPSPEARARLVGGLFSGAAVLGGGAGLGELLRRRAKALFAEFRTLDQPFELATVAGQAALSLSDTEEIWAARALVLNAPLEGLARVMRDAAPLQPVKPTRRRVFRHYRGPREVFPEVMCDRVICVPDPSAGAEPPVVTLARRPAPDADALDLVASAIGPADAPTDEMQAWIERVLRRLLPFSERGLQARPLPEPVWDTDALLCDPADGGWPRAPDTRLSARPAIHQLDRAVLGGLGFEGDLLLGLHAADAIAGDLP